MAAEPGSPSAANRRAADPVVSPADTPKNPGATIAEVLILTEGYLNDGYGKADLRERLAKARPALDALMAVGERDRRQIAQLTEALELADMALNWHDPRIIPTPDVPTRAAATRAACDSLRAVLGHNEGGK